MKKILIVTAVLLMHSTPVQAQEYSILVNEQEKNYLLEVLEMSYTGKTTDKQRRWLDNLYAKVKGAVLIDNQPGKKQGGINPLEEPEIQLDYDELEVPEEYEDYPTDEDKLDQ